MKRKFINGALWFLIFGSVLALPIYYKFIWPFIIGGEPAKPSSVDVLAFWGAVFAGIITLVSVVMTIKTSQQQLERTIRVQQIEKFMDSFPQRIENINELKLMTALLASEAAEISHFISDPKRDNVDGILKFFSKVDSMEKIYATDAYIYNELKTIILELEEFNEQFLDLISEKNRIMALVSAAKELDRASNNFKNFNVKLDKYKKFLFDKYTSYAKEIGLLELK